MASHIPDHQIVADVTEHWRASLWVLQALRPSRRESAVPSTLRRRKLVENLHVVTCSQGAASVALHANVAPGAPFLQSLMWWATIRGVDDEVLHRWNLEQLSAGEALLGVGRTQSGAHAILAAFAGARVAVPDNDFSEAEIRAAVLRRVVRP